MLKEKWLFTIDLDGTLLQDSIKGKISIQDKKSIWKLIKEGHIVSLVTGRPWISTKKTYEELKLNTIVANYNGAQIHNPTDYNFNPTISCMNLNDVMYILGDKKLKESMSNLAIEGPGWVMLHKRDKNLENIFGFTNAAKLRIGINFHKLPLKPTGVIFDTKPGIDVLKLKDYLERKYGDLVEFSSWSKGKGLTPVFDMTNVGITKAKAVSLLARYYDVPLKRTVSIGDGYNDVPMLKTTEISVSMLNATEDIKKITTYTTIRDNRNSGVSDFIDKFLKNKDNFINNLKKKRKELHNIKDETT